MVVCGLSDVGNREGQKRKKNNLDRFMCRTCAVPTIIVSARMPEAFGPYVFRSCIWLPWTLTRDDKQGKQILVNIGTEGSHPIVQWASTMIGRNGQLESRIRRLYVQILTDGAYFSMRGFLLVVTMSIVAD